MSDFFDLPVERLRPEGRAEIAYRRMGNGPPLLLLHGFPQTHAMWHATAPLLAERFTVITADLRGYGDSEAPEGAAEYSFREMAADQAALMQALGFDRFHLVGHDRGARTAHRLALDHAPAVETLTVMDIVPTQHLLSELSHEVARDYYHWFFLSQPAPRPEKMIAADPDFFYESCLLGWGGGTLKDFDDRALAAYRASWRLARTIEAMCNDYRAAIDVDLDLDTQDLGRRVDCPALVLYGGDGVMAQAYDVAATWRDRLADMRCESIPGGHFLIDKSPGETARRLLAFLPGG
jgi:haloacetate dehalogenase